MSRSKYGAVRTNGRASKKEARRAQELQLLARCGAISGLEEQVRYEIVPKQDGERAAHYVADFRYLEGGETIIEDSKGFRTSEYILKRKLMKHLYGITIRET